MHVNHQFLYHLQEALNPLPDLTDSLPVTTQSSPSCTNDEILVVYLSNLLRALHLMRWWIMRRQLGKLWLRTLATRYAQILDKEFLTFMKFFFLVLLNDLSKPLMSLCPICFFFFASVRFVTVIWVCASELKLLSTDQYDSVNSAQNYYNRFVPRINQQTFSECEAGITASESAFNF